MKFDRKSLTNDQLITFYKALLKPRMIEEKMMLQLRQGRISKWFSAYGQEATSVGATLAMDEDEFILPMHRNLGIFTTRGIPLEKLFAQYQAKKSSYTQGRDRSHHFGAKELNLVGMISHLGAQLGIADGIALSHLLDKRQKATLVVSGDGGASEGDFHEALNVASVWNLPVIFLIEANYWGLSTPKEEQYRFKSFVDKGVGYGMKALKCDGNNILDVYHTVLSAARDMRKDPKPYLVECETFRVRGHEEASGTKYYPQGITEPWEKKDPVENYQNFLLKESILNEADIEGIKLNLRLEINKAVETAFAEETVEVNTQKELDEVFAPKATIQKVPSIGKKEMRFIDAVSLGLRQSMEQHAHLVLMGQDIAEYGGAFKVTQDLYKDFGKDRVRNTPLCESAILGAALGLSVQGKKAMVEMQFADFVSCGFNQIVNNLAKVHWRWGQNADVVIRMPTGAGVAAGPFHSQSNEAWFFHVPGLKIFYPAFPDEAKGLLLEAFNDPNPVMFFEHKALYRSLSGEVEQAPVPIEAGKASVVLEGTKLSIITYGMGVHWALDLAQEHEGIEVINLRTLAPLDWDTVFESVRKTNKAIVLHEDNLTGGIGGEIAARITEECFEFLDAPVKRVASLDTPIPFSENLEKNYLANSRLKEVAVDLLAY